MDLPNLADSSAEASGTAAVSAVVNSRPGTYAAMTHSEESARRTRWVGMRLPDAAHFWSFSRGKGAVGVAIANFKKPLVGHNRVASGQIVSPTSPVRPDSTATHMAQAQSPSRADSTPSPMIAKPHPVRENSRGRSYSPTAGLATLPRGKPRPGPTGSG